MSSPPINLNLTFGTLLVGTYISTSLFGFMSLQTYSYYTSYPKDRGFLKALVSGTIWTLELLHTIFVTRSYYEMTIVNFGSLESLAVLPFVLKFSIIWDHSVSCIVQAFFAYRIRIMSGRWELAIFCWSLSALRYITAVIAAIEGIKIPQTAIFYPQWKWIIVLFLAAGAVNDMLIAGGLGFYLSKNRSGIPSTDRVINWLIKFTIQSGLISSILATLMLIFYLVMPDNFIWLAVYVCIAKTYSNSLLATLNARNSLRSNFDREGGVIVGGGSSHTGSGLGPTSRQNVPGISSMLRPKAPSQPITIEMTKVTTTKMDEHYVKDDLKTNTDYADYSGESTSQANSINLDSEK